MASPTNVRFPEPVDKGLAAYARRAGLRKSTVVVGALREWLRMEAHPGIMFGQTVTGERRATLAAGPQVWTVAEAWQQHSARERQPAALAATLGLTERDVDTALAYWAEYRDEIDQLIERHHADQDDASSNVGCAGRRGDVGRGPFGLQALEQRCSGWVAARA